MKVIIAPGITCTPSSHWYPWLVTELAAHGIPAVIADFPFPNTAPEAVWVPHLLSLGAGPGCVLVGHSSGAQAAMRLAETTQLEALVLVAACVTDLNDPVERASGYYGRPWEWGAIKANVSRGIVQFADADDKWIPLAEAEAVHAGLSSELVVRPRGRHFMTKKFPELLERLLALNQERHTL